MTAFYFRTPFFLTMRSVALMALLGMFAGTAVSSPSASPVPVTVATVPTQAFTTSEASGTSRYVLEKMSQTTIPGSTATNVGAAEFMTWGKKQQEIYVVNVPEKVVDIFGLATDGSITTTGKKFTAETADATPNSVCYNERDDVVGIAYGSTGKGWIEFFNAETQEHISTHMAPNGLTLAAHCSFGPSDACAYIALEGEPYTNIISSVETNPYGGVLQVCATDFKNSMTHVASSSTFAGLTSSTITELASKKGWHNPQKSTNGNGITDLEPEYITYSSQGSNNKYEVYVCLQEANMIAVYEGTTAATSIALTTEPIRFMPIGFKDNNFVGNEIDLANDNKIDIKTFKGVKSMYQPDSIVSFRQNGKDYILMASEGKVSSTETTNSLNVEASVLSYENGVVNSPFGVEGDVMVSRSSPGLQANGNYDGIYLFGGRSFVVMDAASGAVVHESGSQFEKLIEKYAPVFFGIDDGVVVGGEQRSTTKGPEPESLTVGEVGGVPLMFVGLERTGLIAVYDIADVTAPKFHSFGSSLDETSMCDARSKMVDPEALKFIAAADNPTNQDILIASGSVSNSLTIFKVVKKENPNLQMCREESKRSVYSFLATSELVTLRGQVNDLIRETKVAQGTDFNPVCEKICTTTGTITCVSCTITAGETIPVGVMRYEIHFKGSTAYSRLVTAVRVNVAAFDIIGSSFGISISDVSIPVTTATVPTEAFPAGEAPGSSRYVLETLSHTIVPGSTLANDGAAEFMTWGKKLHQVYVVNGPAKQVDVLDMKADGTFESSGKKFSSADADAEPTSVCYNERDDVVGVAYGSTGKGWIELYNAETQARISTYMAPNGLTLADHCSFGPSDACVYAALEGEPYTNAAGVAVNPYGGIIQVCATDFKNEGTHVFSSTTFESLTTATMDELRIKKGWHNPQLFTNGDGKSDLEPEYITYSSIASDNTYEIYVGIQEANMIAVFKGTAATPSVPLSVEPIRFMPIGFKDNSFVGNGIDIVNDKIIDIKTFKGVKSMYQPDSIASLRQNGRDYIFMASEGDESSYEDDNGLSVQAKELTYEDGVVNNPLGVEGDMKMSKSSPGLQANGKYDGIYLFGGRSFVVMDAASGAVVHESGSQFEKLIEKYAPQYFGIDDGEFSVGEQKSQKKGPEPESLDVGEVGGVPLLFVGLEKSSLIAVYDVKDVAAPKFHSFGSVLDDEKLCTVNSKLLGPEALKFVPKADNPTDFDLLISSGSGSNSITVFKVYKKDNADLTPCAAETPAPETPIPSSPTPAPTLTPPPTPVPSRSANERAADFNVLVDMELVDVVKNINSIGNAARGALGSSTTPACGTICEIETSACFTCAGTATTTGEIASTAAKRYSVAYKAFTVYGDADSKNRLTAALKPVVEAAGGVFVGVNAVFGDVVTDDDDGLSGGAIAGIVIGSVSFVIVVAVIAYCCFCKPVEELETCEDPVQKTSPDEEA